VRVADIRVEEVPKAGLRAVTGGGEGWNVGSDGKEFVHRFLRLHAI
jgi:hypothetical protein